MKLKLIRDTFTDESTIGKLYVDGSEFCDTLEDMDRKLESGGKKVYGKTCVPRGTYEVIVDFSTKYNREMPHVLGVPQFTGIRIHPLNVAAESEGCIGVGKRGDAPNFIGNSKVTFNKLMALLDEAYAKSVSITLEII